jgi:hypothetical protein
LFCTFDLARPYIGEKFPDLGTKPGPSLMRQMVLSRRTHGTIVLRHRGKVKLQKSRRVCLMLRERLGWFYLYLDCLFHVMTTWEIPIYIVLMAS